MGTNLKKSKQVSTSVVANSKSTVSRSDMFSHTTVTNLNPDRVDGTPQTNHGGISYDSSMPHDITVTTDSVNDDNPIIGESL